MEWRLVYGMETVVHGMETSVWNGDLRGKT